MFQNIGHTSHGTTGNLANLALRNVGKSKLKDQNVSKELSRSLVGSGCVLFSQCCPPCFRGNVAHIVSKYFPPFHLGAVWPALCVRPGQRIIAHDDSVDLPTPGAPSKLVSLGRGFFLNTTQPPTRPRKGWVRHRSYRVQLGLTTSNSVTSRVKVCSPSGFWPCSLFPSCIFELDGCPETLTV